MTNHLWTTWFDTVNGLMGAAAQTAAAATGARGAAGDTPPAGVFDLWKISLEQYERAAKPWAELTQPVSRLSDKIAGCRSGSAGCYLRAKREVRALQRSVRAAGRNGHQPPGATLPSAPGESDAG